LVHIIPLKIKVYIVASKLNYFFRFQQGLYRQPSKPWLEPRNKQLLEITGLGGDDIARELWKKLSGYHKRSLVETAFFRWKQLLGSGLKSRKFENQIVESKIKCQILNKMRLAS